MAQQSQIELAGVFSSAMLFGPPMSDTLIEMVCHLFSPKEAVLARHLPYYIPRSAATIARRAKRDLSEVRDLLEVMADRKVIYRSDRGYALLPLIPGMFEYMLMDGRDSDWYRKYAKLINALFSSGYTRTYSSRKSPSIRNIPIYSAIEPSSRVMQPDMVSEMIDRHDKLAVLNVCQCRQSLEFDGKECSRSSSSDGCLVFGSFAESVVENESGYMVGKEEMKEIVTDRYEKNLVFMTANIEPSSPNAICTCCDCCCHYIESINHFGGRISLASPRFIANVDETLCNNCGRCVKVCNTYAHTMEGRQHHYDVEKCIGCGLCVSACKQRAVKMEDNPTYQKPSKNWAFHGLRILPAGILSILKVRLLRKK